MSIIYGTKINQLLTNTAPTGLLFADWMKKEGYSGQLQKRYRDSGWLTAMCKGVMYRTGSRLSAYDAIASYNKQMGGQLRVAAMSALEYAGFNHYVPRGKPVLMVAAPTCKMPLWMQSDMYDGKRIRDAAFFLIIMLVTFAATLLNPQKYVSSRTIQKCVEHVSTST